MASINADKDGEKSGNRSSKSSKAKRSSMISWNKITQAHKEIAVENGKIVKKKNNPFANAL